MCRRLPRRTRCPSATTSPCAHRSCTDIFLPTAVNLHGVGNSRMRVLIIGGGFGGLFCARRLGGVDVDVTLLDRSAGHLVQPLLYQCATGTLGFGQISRPLREEFERHRNVTTLLGEAVDIDPELRRVTARRPDETTFTLDYDVLVVAAGMQQSY
ncbi:FAD-dependent oxidoreductase, partial [Streptomyces sp. DSM 41534]